MAGPPAAEREVSQPGLRMLGEMDLADLSRSCGMLGVKIEVDLDGEADHITFRGSRLAYSVRNTVVIMRGNALIFVKASRKGHDGGEVIDFLAISPERIRDETVAVLSAPRQIREASRFAREYIAPNNLRRNMAVVARAERAVSPQPEMEMVRDINLERLAGVVGESVARVGGGGDARIARINCDSLGLSLMVAVVDRDSGILDHISFEGDREAHRLNDGRVAVVWGKEGDSVTFVHRPRIIGGGNEVVDVVRIVRGEEFSDVTIPLDKATEEVRIAANFVKQNTAVPKFVDHPDGSY